VLLVKLRHVWAGGDPAAYLVPDAAIEAFMAHCAGRIGDAYFRTPRTTIRSFLDLLAVLDQHRDLDWRTLIDAVEIEEDRDPDLAALHDTDPAVAGESDDELSPFRL
jgi:hypothetical protein